MDSINKNQQEDNHKDLLGKAAVEKIKDLGESAKDAAVQLLFQGSKYSDFLNIYGEAEISRDKARIEEFWGPILKTWFTEGKDDPRITVIKVTPTEGYYWDNKHGNAVAFVKTAVGAALGKTMDDSIEGSVKLQ